MHLENTFDEFQKKQIKLGKIILLIVLICESVNLIPGVLFTDLWLPHWAYNYGIFGFLNRLLPIITFACSLVAFCGYPFGRYTIATIYGLNAWRLLVMVGYYFEALPAVRGILTVFAVAYPIFSLYYVFMSILIFSYRGVKEYMYGKLYK